MVIQLLPGGVKLNIDYGATPPSDTTKLWVPLATKPSAVECSPVLKYGSEVISTTQYALPDAMSAGCSGNGAIGKYIYMIAGRKVIKEHQLAQLAVLIPKQVKQKMFILLEHG